jgi:fatty aldehyde-generating acyl-ACP reductase
MDCFAFVVHPVDPKRDVARKYPYLAHALPTSLVQLLSRFWPPVCLSHIAGARSEATGKEIEGWLLACPLTAWQALELPTWAVYNKIIATGRLAQRLGARILGLGAFMSVPGILIFLLRRDTVSLWRRLSKLWRQERAARVFDWSHPPWL